MRWPQRQIWKAVKTDDRDENDLLALLDRPVNSHRSFNYALRACFVLSIAANITWLVQTWQQHIHYGLAETGGLASNSNFEPNANHPENPDPLLSREWMQFDSSIVPQSKFVGYGPDVDSQWNRFTKSHGTAVVMAVTEEDVASAGKRYDDRVPFNTTVPIGEDFMGTIEVFHQLHCLVQNVLRKFVHRNYYQDQDPFFDTHSVVDHSDHCVEILRQVLMCQSDTQLITFHWVDGWRGAVPDFNTWHQCRDPEKVLQWAQQRAAPLSKPLLKPDDAITLPDRP